MTKLCDFKRDNPPVWRG